MIRRNCKSKLQHSVPVISNNFKLIPKKNITIYQYDISFKDITNDKIIESPSKFASISAFEALKFEEGIAFDGKKNVYSPRLLDERLVEFPVGRNKFEATLQGSTKRCSVKDILDAIKTPDSIIPSDVMSILYILLNHSITRNNQYQRHGRGFLALDQEGTPLNEGLKIFTGFKFSLIPTEGCGLNLRTLKNFVPIIPKLSLLDFIFEGRRIEKTMSEHMIKKKSGLLRRQKVQTSHGGRVRTYTIMGLSQETSASYYIPDLGQTIEVYFKESYKMKLKYPHLPCVKVDMKTLLPLELCELETQPLQSKLPPAVQSDYIRVSKEAPTTKYNSIVKCKDILIQEVNPWLERYYGLCIENSQPIQVKAKLLSPPKIINEVKNQGGVEVRNGSWRNNKVMKSFGIPGKDGLMQMISLVRDFNRQNLGSMYV